MPLPSITCQHFKTSSPQKSLGQLKPNFIWSLHGLGEKKVCSNSPGHMTKMAAMPIYGKNHLLWNQKADDLETWYAALGACVLPNLLK